MNWFVPLPRTVGVIGILSGLLTTGCDRSEPTLAPKKPAEVVITSPIIREVTDYEDFTGRTEAAEAAAIRSRVTGYLKEVRFKDGADVRPGDLLFVIDRAPYQAAYDKAKASVALAEARLERVRKDFDRITDLAKGTAVSQGEMDLIAGEKAESEATVGVAKAELRLAEENLHYTEIRAPFAGRISRRLLDPGNLILADDTILTTLVSLDPVHAYFDVDERTLLRLRRLVRSGSLPVAADGQARVQVGLADESEFSLDGVLDFVDNQLDPGTGTLRVRAEVANPYHLLSPGLFVRIRFPTSVPHEAVLIPEEAVGTDQGQKYVYLVSDKDEVVYRTVTLGQQFNGMRVITSGLTTADRAIISGMQRVRPGVKVSTRAQPPPKVVEDAPAPKTPSPPSPPSPPPEKPTAGVAGL